MIIVGNEGIGKEIRLLRTALKKIRAQARRDKPDPDKIWKLANDALEGEDAPLK